jgi:hypothetical protein
MLQNSSSRIASVYLAFAEREARGRSPVYEGLARAIANDSVALSFLAQLPRAKQQPNLLFAAVKYLYGTRTDWDSFRHLLLQYWDEIKATITVRSTQTNEPARCATLIPLFSLLPPPLALLEVGAAAGLCLLPDAYGYDYEGHRVAPSLLTSAAAPTFRCRANRAPLPKAGLQIIWRAGVDLRPIDIKNPEQVAWLEALVWPDEGNRVELLRAALKVSQQYPLRLVHGDLRTDIGNLVAQMPKDAPRVVFHTAVMGYLSSAADRSAFCADYKRLKCSLGQ